jgi:hypothetical protein
LTQEPDRPQPRDTRAVSGPSAGGETNPWLVGFLLLSVLVALGVAICLQVHSTDAALVAATWGLFGVIALWVGGALLWGAINPRAAEEPDLSELLRNAANVVITVDGVVLGLVYTFSTTRGASVPTVVKVGALALVLGVVVGLLLYSLVAGKITTRTAVMIATGLFSLVSWSLAYGLLCIVFALVLPA